MLTNSSILSKNSRCKRLRVVRCRALGQRTFKSEPQVDHLAPNATQLGSTFVNWLLSNFSWLFAAAQTNATLGQSYLYDGDQAGALGQTPVLLGEYGNGSANSSARLEYIWLPTQAGQAIPVGLYRAGELFAIHSDHLGTPRRLTNSLNRTDWQLPYSAFGETRPTGTITPTTDATLAFALDAATGTRLATTSPPFALNLRFAGQYFDSESNLNYNYFRSYQPTQGRYTQSDPIGLEGGLNRYAYANGAPLMYIDPEGLQGRSGGAYLPRGTVPSAPVMTENGGVASVRSGMNQFTNMPNPSSNIPGAWSGINYPWSMPRLGKVCVRCAGGSPENSCSRLAGSPNMSMPADKQTCQCVEWNTVQLP